MFFERLVEKAEKAKLIPNELVTSTCTSFREDQWVLVRGESRNKFEGRWYGPAWLREHRDRRARVKAEKLTTHSKVSRPALLGDCPEERSMKTSLPRNV